MAVFLIGYDLSQPGRDYKDLFEAIEALGAATHVLDSTWLVDAESTASGIRDALGKIIDTNDHLLVIAVKAGAGWATRRVDSASTDWLQEHI